MIGALRGHGVKRVGDGEEAPLDGDVVAGQAGRIPVPVPMFVMMERIRDGRLEMVHAGQHVRADAGMLPHHLPFAGVEMRGFVEDGARHDDFANIVQQRAEFENGELLGLPSQRFGQAHGVLLDALNVAARVLVADLDDVGQHQHRLHVRGAAVKQFDGPSPLEFGADSQAQLVGIERFEDVIVGA